MYTLHLTNLAAPLLRPYYTDAFGSYFAWREDEVSAGELYFDMYCAAIDKATPTKLNLRKAADRVPLVPWR